MTIRLMTFCLLALLFNSLAFGDMVVNRSIVIYDDPTLAKSDVVVFNNSAESNLYVQVDAYRVEQPGAADQLLVKLTPETTPEFLASPNKLIVTPGNRNIVRFLNLDNSGDKELVYRVNLIPVTPPVELDDSEGAVRSRLDVVVAYQVLVIVLPHEPVVNVGFARTGNIASFRNSGNANYLLTDGEQCNPLEPTDCRILENRRIYPGNSWSMALPFDGPFSYKVRTHDGLTSRQFN